MKKIRIDEVDKIREAIDEAEGRRTMRCIKAEDAIKVLNRWASQFPKAWLRGCKVLVDGGYVMPKSYRYPAYMTCVTFCHDTVGWYMESVGVTRCCTQAYGGHKNELTLLEHTEEFKQKVLERAWIEVRRG